MNERALLHVATPESGSSYDIVPLGDDAFFVVVSERDLPKVLPELLAQFGRDSVIHLSQSEGPLDPQLNEHLKSLAF